MLELCIPRVCPILTGPVPQIPGPFLGELMATQGERLTYRWKQVTPGHSHTPCFLLLPVPKALYFKVTWQFLSQVCDAQGRRLDRGRLHHRAALHFFPSPQFMMDASNPTQLSASCVQLLGLLSAEPLAEASVLILFNKTDLPCYMTIEEMKSLIRLPDIIACAKQNITIAEISARKGTGLTEVLRWLQDTHRTST
ncbi:hypothetical protein mRhiFer1_000987 [Rhinolophus ferrumequinum]|uniref:ADP ribosylation factor like GTPase 16 n=1 Tax=Rhinolophus ferrumequinum TaxID=59479 RepID=A0A7J7TB91_RHIFE|nr:ADP-ribosylation factor-like protein 16 isoform X1 [Rhinolophus ferrumequinum]KAF6298016.1 hypothetical protein mRhiFer1_000987 [Rhinolophus ferrumequinum]